jgi:DNA-binding NarL/FixJ family response regulator
VPYPPPVAADKGIVTVDTLSPIERRIRELHSEGKINKEIASQIEQEGMKCGGWKVSTVLRKLGLESHGKRLGGRRWEKRAEAVEDGSSEEAAAPRKRKTADERKEEVAALLEQGKSVEEIAAATGLKESSVKLYCSILKARRKELPGREAAPPEAETPEDDEWDQGPFYCRPEELGRVEESDEERAADAEEEDIRPAPAKSQRTTEETNAQIRTLHRKNRLPMEIAEIMNLSIETVKQRMSSLQEIKPTDH